MAFGTFPQFAGSSGGGGGGGGGLAAETQAIIDRVEADGGTVHSTAALGTFVDALVAGSVYNTSIIDGMWLPGLASKIDGSRNVSKLYDLSTAGPTAYSSYRYYRLDFTGNNGAAFVSIGELQGLDSSGTNVFPSTMTSNSSAGAVSSASSELTAAFQVWEAFSGDLTDGWVSDNEPDAYIQIDVGASVQLASYQLTFADPAGAPSGGSGWTLYASNTGSFSGEEVVLDTQSGISGWVARTYKTFSLPKLSWDLDGDASPANQQVLTTAAAGIDGLPMIDFDPTKYGYAFTGVAHITTGSPYSVFAVYRTDDGSSSRTVFNRGSSSSTNQFLYYNDNLTAQKFIRGSTVQVTDNISQLGIRLIVNSGNSASDTEVFRNNSVLDTINTGTREIGSSVTAGNDIGVGCRAVTALNSLVHDGPLLAIVSCPPDLTTAQRNTIFNALDALFPSAS